MLYKLRLGDLVMIDAEKARVWYERQASGLGARLEDEFFAALDEVARHPLGRPPCLTAQQTGLRHQLLASFPYALYFRVVNDEIRVLLFFHGARNPATLNRKLTRREF